jgi:hypothetical protein
VCRFRIAAGKAKHWTRCLINYPELSQASKNHLQSFGFFPFRSINLGFLLRENLAAIFIIPSSWGFQLDGALHYHTVPHHTASLYCDDMITPNQHDELTLFLGCEELSRKTSLVDMSAFDMDSFLQGFHLYCFDNCHTNTYIQNVIKDEALPKYDRTNMCFVLINEKEESSKVSSIVCDKKPGYVEKLPFKPLPLKEDRRRRIEGVKGERKRYLSLSMLLLL